MVDAVEVPCFFYGRYITGLLNDTKQILLAADILTDLAKLGVAEIITNPAETHLFFNLMDSVQQTPDFLLRI